MKIILTEESRWIGEKKNQCFSSPVDCFYWKRFFYDCAKITDVIIRRLYNWKVADCDFSRKRTRRENFKVNYRGSTSIKAIIQINFYKLNSPFELEIRAILYAFCIQVFLHNLYSTTFFYCTVCATSTFSHTQLIMFDLYLLFGTRAKDISLLIWPTALTSLGRQTSVNQTLALLSQKNTINELAHRCTFH